MVRSALQRRSSLAASSMPGFGMELVIILYDVFKILFFFFVLVNNVFQVILDIVVANSADSHGPRNSTLHLHAVYVFHVNLFVVITLLVVK